jgi:serine/threonine protein kinase
MVALCAACGATSRIGSKFCGKCGKHLLLKERYNLLSNVGQGGFGTVYKAEDTLFNNRIVAIKELSQQGMTAQEKKEAALAFQREARLLASLSHPNLPEIYDQFPEGANWYLAMRFLEGKTLETYLSEATNSMLPILEALDIGVQLCTVLDYLHTQQPPIIFRDLKPANIMRVPDGQVYLIDFGIARLFKPGQAKDTAAFGSPGYAAPEQYGNAQTTPRSDIYSLGAIFHQLLSGNDPSLNTPLLWDFPSLPVSVPPGLASLIVQMVKLRMEERPVSVAAIKQELERIVNDVTTQQKDARPLVPVSPVVRSSPVLPPQSVLRYGFVEAIRLNLTTSYAFREKGYALVELKRYEEALPLLEEAIRLDPTDGFAFRQKGLALNELKRYEEALPLLEEAIRLDPTDKYAIDNRAFTLNELKRYEEAIRASDEAIRLDPTDSYAFRQKGFALNRLKRYEEALPLLEEAIRLDPTDKYAFRHKGYTLRDLGRYEEAIRAFDEAIRLDPTDGFAFRQKGFALEILGRKGEGEEAYKRANELDQR